MIVHSGTVRWKISQGNEWSHRPPEEKLSCGASLASYADWLHDGSASMIYRTEIPVRAGFDGF
ncbi:MAG: hypothetical protein DWH91_10570 [Planctomycetota bacterium]|nr:MAG: hypothetical protein DWH91_10570 [Planctomycetota bacterium]